MNLKKEAQKPKVDDKLSTVAKVVFDLTLLVTVNESDISNGLTKTSLIFLDCEKKFLWKKVNLLRQAMPTKRHN